MNIILGNKDDETDDEYETEVINGILTFDELLEDDYYKSEYEKRVQQRLNEYNKNSEGGV